MLILLFKRSYLFFSSLMVCCLFFNIQAKPPVTNSCIKYRAAIDVGSGTTKMKVAEVDACKKSLIKIIHKIDKKVSYKKDLSASAKGQFSATILQLGMKILKQLKAVAHHHGAYEIRGVATSAFRKASNGSSFLSKVKKQLGISIDIISQKEEAELGFWAAVAGQKVSPEQAVVWDIGGGSMQISSLLKSNQMEIYQGKLASVSMKEHIIRVIQNRSLSEYSSPNPMTKKVMLKAVNYAKKVSQQVVPVLVKKLQTPGVSVIGIGGVHYYSIRGQTGKPQRFNQQIVKDTLLKKVGYTDQKIGGKYASTELSNLALVLGFMQGMNVKEVTPLNINMADGILINSKYW